MALGNSKPALSLRPIYRSFYCNNDPKRSSSGIASYMSDSITVHRATKNKAFAPLTGVGVGSHRYSSLLPRRTFSSSEIVSNPEITLYQYQICPFCNKTKALLDYLALPYKVVEVNPLTKAELKPWSGSYRKVPIAVFRDDATNESQQINGSHDIISSVLEDGSTVADANLRSKLRDKDAADFRESASSRWTEFADERLAKILYPNICRTLSDSRDAFAYVDEVSTFTPWQRFTVRYAGSVAMYAAASRIKKKLGVEDERSALHDALDDWEREGLDNGNKMFCSGTDAPDMGDIAVFGTLRSIEALPSFREIVKVREADQKYVTLKWYDRMKIECGLKE